MGMTAPSNRSPARFEGSVADIGRDGSISIRSAAPGPPRRIDGYTIGAIANIDGPGPHGGEVHPDGDEFLYVVSGTMELILDDGDERAVGVETTHLLRSGDAYVVPRGVWHRLEPVEPSYLINVTPGPHGGHRPRRSAGRQVEDRVRSICLGLPGVTEKLSHGSPAFFVGKQFVMLWAEGHHDHEFPHLWCAAPPGTQEAVIAADPSRYFRPPYVGGRGWIGMRLVGAPDWDEVAAMCEDAFRAVAPKRLIEMLDSPPENQ